MKNKLLMASMVALLLGFVACEKSLDNSPAQGGNLPTNYVVIHDSSFAPANISIVAGNSITFLNQTSSVQTIMTFDSITIPPTSIDPNRSFFFKKDTTGLFIYKNVNKPTAMGSFELRP